MTAAEISPGDWILVALIMLAAITVIIDWRGRRK